MKKTILAVLLAVLTIPAFASDLVLGFVDVNKIATELEVGPGIQKKLDAEFTDQQESLKAKSKEFQKKEEKYKKDVELMSDDEKAKAELELSNLYREIIRAQNQLQEDAMARSQEEHQKFAQKLETAINALAKDKKYDAILNAQAALMLKPELNVTDDVLAILKKA